MNQIKTYLQFLHFNPNNIPFPHTVQVWDIQYLVENLPEEPEMLRLGRILFNMAIHH